MCLLSPGMNPTEFINNYISELLQKYPEEDKTINANGRFQYLFIKIWS